MNPLQETSDNNNNENPGQATKTLTKARDNFRVDMRREDR